MRQPLHPTPHRPRRPDPVPRRRRYRTALATAATAALVAATSPAGASDWPMWRHDAGRTASTAEQLPANPAALVPRWQLQLPPLEPAFRNPRLHFDAGYEPVVAGGRLLVASSHDDSVTAYAAADGRRAWRFFAGGPVRFAPAVWEDRVFFGSDDGQVYCLDLTTGKTLWTFRAVPDRRRLIGNRRLISVWPVRGGPVVADGRVYFAAGVWPSEGVFVYALEAETGEVAWLNDRLGYRYSQHPHATEAIGGLAPQGYLVVDGERLVVPCSTAYPALLDRATGRLIEFDLPRKGRHPGGWFAAVDADTAKAARRGQITFDSTINSERHEDNKREGDGRPGASRSITAGGVKLDFDQPLPGIDGTVHTVLAADGALFVVTRGGTITCLAPAGDAPLAPRRAPAQDPGEESAPAPHDPPPTLLAQEVLKAAETRHGYALLWGSGGGVDTALAAALATESELHLVGVCEGGDTAALDRARRALQGQGLHGHRVALVGGGAAAVPDLPPFVFNLAVVGPGVTMEADDFGHLYRTLRPYGGTALFRPGNDEEARSALEFALGAFAATEPGAEVSRAGPGKRWFLLRKQGALPGATDYRGGWAASPDASVRFPLGVVWYGDHLGHFKRSPQPTIAGGVMVSYPKDWTGRGEAKPPGGSDYTLLPPVFSDVYTGRVLTSEETAALREAFPPPDPARFEPSQYRPPKQKNAWKPEQPRAGLRTNPLTGLEEVRAFPKTYGCDGGVDYGILYTLRSGTAAFYDKSLESGTTFISGPRSGCTNSIIPANGLLNVPYFYEGCTCSYPLPVGLALAGMPESHEQWSVWGTPEEEGAGAEKRGTPVEGPAAPGPPIRRVGINFGAPGVRATRAGTLWLDFPNAGAPAPAIRATTSPAETDYYYRHSLFVEGGEGWPWVAASGAEGLRQFTLENLAEGDYTATLTFAARETPGAPPHRHRQNVALQGRTVLHGFDPAETAGGPLRGAVRAFPVDVRDGRFTLQLEPVEGTTTQISGIELVPAL